MSRKSRRANAEEAFEQAAMQVEESPKARAQASPEPHAPAEPALQHRTGIAFNPDANQATDPISEFKSEHASERPLSGTREAEPAALGRSGQYRQRQRSRQSRGANTPPPVWPGMQGGRFLPLTEQDVKRIHRAALDVLAETGMGEVPPVVRDALAPKGLALDGDGRMRFPAALVEDTLAAARRDVVLWGQGTGSKPAEGLDLSGARVHAGSGGAAPNVIDPVTGAYRPSTLEDLHQAARVVDALDHLHFFCRSLVATDLSDLRALDVNTAYASLVGTSKHVTVQASLPEHVPLLADLAQRVAGGRDAFATRPILSLNINHVVPPLRFDEASAGVMAEAARCGIPFHINAFDQAGASSPAALAGAVVQSVAETLAGLVFAHAVNPACLAIFGPRPMITDLRSGAMTGGCGEQAIAMAAAVQMGRFYDLPTSCIAGAADSKIADVQSGYEKALAVALAAHAGCNFITQAGGMQAGLMGTSLASYVIDNEMLGAIFRTIRGVEVNDETLSVSIIDEAVRGEGHFLGAPDTLNRMNSDFLYPTFADRASPEEWEAGGRPDLSQRSSAHARALVENHFPDHVDPSLDADLRTEFDIRLPLEAMGPAYSGSAAAREERAQGGDKK